jgi:hypothetical protein
MPAAALEMEHITDGIDAGWISSCRNFGSEDRGFIGGLMDKVVSVVSEISGPTPISYDDSLSLSRARFAIYSLTSLTRTYLKIPDCC